MVENAVRQYKDPANLTKTERETYDLHKQGVSNIDIASKLGVSPRSVSGALRVAKEKIELIRVINEQDRRLSWN